MRLVRAIIEFLIYVNPDSLECANIKPAAPWALLMTSREDTNPSVRNDRFAAPARGLATSPALSSPPRALTAAPVAQSIDRETTIDADSAGPSRFALHPRQFLWLLGRLFPPNLAIDVVTTTAVFDAPPDAVWETMLFYEEVPHRPPLLLRLFLPSPVKTQANGKHVGTVVECIYSTGGLSKRITVLERPRLLCFEVLEQRLGAERCMTTVEGSYEFRTHGRGTEVALTTRYHGHLRPRRLWRHVERMLAHDLHRHILAGMGAARVLPDNTTGHATS